MLAQNLDEIQNIGLPDFEFKNGSIGEIISEILNDYVFFIAGLLLLVYLVIGGLQLMLSRGDPKAMQSAQGRITNALIGFIIVIFAFIIVKLVGQIFGVDSIDAVFSG